MECIRGGGGGGTVGFLRGVHVWECRGGKGSESLLAAKGEQSARTTADLGYKYDRNTRYQQRYK